MKKLIPPSPVTTPQIIPAETETKAKPKKRKPKTANVYFTTKTEDAIVAYNIEPDQIKRNILYNSEINYAFNKLAENIIHTFKFYYTDVNSMAELKHEVVTFLLNKIHLYKKDKGKAYSYFGTIAKRYLIIYNEKNYKKLKDSATLEEVDEDKKVFRELASVEANSDLSTFIDLFIEYISINLSKLFPKEQESKIADAIIELFRKREHLDVFNKKALFLYTREMVDVKTPQITRITKKLKEIYIKLYNIYYREGDINIYQIV